MALTTRVLLAAGVFTMFGGLVHAEPPAAPTAPSTPVAPPAPAAPTAPEAKSDANPFVLGHTVKSIDGKDVDLGTYKGKVVMIVNVASECGLTKTQYPALQKVYEAKREQGFEIIAFPANNFRGQEPGTNEEIKNFCEAKKITFPLMGKISVLGDDQHALYKQLSEAPAPAGGAPSWNFTKYLVNREGKVVLRIDPRTLPDSEAVTKKIDELLAEKPAAK